MKPVQCRDGAIPCRVVEWTEFETVDTHALLSGCRGVEVVGATNAAKTAAGAARTARTEARDWSVGEMAEVLVSQHGGTFQCVAVFKKA